MKSKNTDDFQTPPDSDYRVEPKMLRRRKSQSDTTHAPTDSTKFISGATYLRADRDLEFLVDEGVIDPEDRDLFSYAESAQEAWDQICHWHESAGSPLFCDDS